MRRKPGDLLPSEVDILRYAASKRDGFYGWQLAREIPNTLQGSVYRTLYRLRDNGLLTSEWQAPTSPGLPGRNIYRLTEPGRRSIESPSLVPVSNLWTGQLGARAV